MNSSSQWAILILTLLGCYVESAKPARNRNYAPAKDICNPLQFHKPHLTDSSKYYECRPLTDAEKRLWGSESLGIWILRSCPDPRTEEFDELFQKCENKRKRRRQYLACASNPGANGCSTDCSAQNTNPVNGNPCSWVSSNLSPDSSNTRNFLQCAPVSPGDSCGQWTRMSCPPDSQFNPQLQICISANLQTNNCAQTQVPICNCDPNQGRGQGAVCPGRGVCQSGTCCLPIRNDVPSMSYPMGQMSPSLCPTGLPPTGPCSVCPQRSMCQPNIGCCPPMTNPQQPQSIFTGTNNALCPDGGLPVCSCDSGCPKSTVCQTSVGCCPLPIQNNALSMGQCPGGMMPTGPCNSGACPPSNMCLPNVGCCPNLMPGAPCSNGMLPIGPCSLGCPTPTSCEPNVGCCTQGFLQPQSQLPTFNPRVQTLNIQIILKCPSNDQPQGLCSSGCPPNTLCMQGICCPTGNLSPSRLGDIPQICSNGLRPVCSCSSGCPSSTSCQTGVGCCPALPPLGTNHGLSNQLCSNGMKPAMPCFLGCPSGSVCEVVGSGNLCPDGTRPLVNQCSDSCPIGSMCQPSVGCCQVSSPVNPSRQMCPGGVQPYSSCSAGCPPTTACQPNVGCCPQSLNQGLVQNIQICSNGQRPIGPCSIGCPSGTACQQGNCCPILSQPSTSLVLPPPPVSMPLCGTGQIPISSCVPTQNCPPGYECTAQGCCPAAPVACPPNGQNPGFCQGATSSPCCPPPVCPNGASPLRSCSSDGQCPPNYLCIGGSCCFQKLPQPTAPVMPSVLPICPSNQQAICQCATRNNACPQGSSCQEGVCCISMQLPISSGGIGLAPNFGQIPGAPCRLSAECNGYVSNAASCGSNGACACLPGSWSNGVQCQQGAQPQFQQNCCQQSAGPCRFAYNKVKRRPQLEPAINDTSEPLFFVPLTTAARKCMDSFTCTPNEVCVNGTCERKKFPGEYGCKHSEECDHFCPSSFCHFDDAKSVGICKCRDGYSFADLCCELCMCLDFDQNL
uniref:Chitin-binding type-2 domain-containing protein n=1 Tax=Romanomermis culicivorax TaxID=13658 RepID=A0A915KKM9_ROMCU